MEFCPRCGTRLIPKKGKNESAGNVALVCPKCGFKKSLTAKKLKPFTKAIEHSPQETIAVISKEEQKLRVLPTVRVECPRCGNNQAFVWQVQTRGSDESSTQFFRCTKCNFTFREYS